MGWCWIGRQKVPLEPVRFAAANYLCVELGYGGTKRLIEPYSLRRTKDGYLLLYAVKTATSELRAYRVDRIESIKVTNTPYKPRYPIEFTSSGPLIAPPTQRVNSLDTSSRLSRMELFMLLSVAIMEDDLSVRLTILACDHTKTRMGYLTVQGSSATKWTDITQKLVLLGS